MTKIVDQAALRAAITTSTAAGRTTVLACQDVAKSVTPRDSDQAFAWAIASAVAKAMGASNEDAQAIATHVAGVADIARGN